MAALLSHFRTYYQGSPDRGAGVMGQKVNQSGVSSGKPYMEAVGMLTKEYGDLLLEDRQMREFIKRDCAQAGVSK